jgi:predicted transcriptional regulator of viral defense system
MSSKVAPPDRAIAELAAVQHSLVAHYQLTDLGLDRNAITYRVKAGRLWVKHRGVYAVGQPRVTIHGELMAAVLAGGPDALLSHWSAGRLWGLVGRRLRPIHVTVPRGHVDGHPGTRFHRTRSLHAEDRAVRDRIPVTSVARTLVDLAAVTTPAQLAKAFEEAIRIDLLDPPALARTLERSNGRRGVKRLRRLLVEELHLPDDTRPGVETEFAAYCRARGLPLPAFNVLVGGHLVDAYWPEHRLAVELDSRAWHRTWQARERDLARDADLLANFGVRVIRITTRRLRQQPDVVEHELRRLLGVASAA